MLTRYNAVPRIIGQDMNVEYEADPNGQLVQADGAVTEIAALKQEVEQMRTYSHETVKGLVDWRDKRISELEAENGRLKSAFNPDWDMREAALESIREHQQMVKELQAENARLSAPVSVTDWEKAFKLLADRTHAPEVLRGMTIDDCTEECKPSK